MAFSTAPVIFDRELLARRRNRAAQAGVFPDFLLRRTAEDFAERLSLIKRTFTRALVLGAANGVLVEALSGTAGIAEIVACETAPACLGEQRNLAVIADEEALPFRDQSFDLVVSGLTLQFVNDLPGTLAQIRRLLRPDGLFLGAMIGGETLTELRKAVLAAEIELCDGVSPRVAPFADVRDIGALLQRAGFALPVADSDVVTVTYPTPFELMRELKAMGASNVLVERRRVPMTRGMLVRIAEIYKEHFVKDAGRIPATFEILTMTGWSPHESQQKPLRPGAAAARLADALGTDERSAGEAAPAPDLP
ncbi:MAG: class I SAM-dependent methyltransferase [Hyphomicrobiaceae bacterium]